MHKHRHLSLVPPCQPFGLIADALFVDVYGPTGLLHLHDLAAVQKTFCTVFETDRASPWRSILQKKTPLHIGFEADSFIWIDADHRISWGLLLLLNTYAYPGIILTRSDLIAEDSYLGLLQAGDYVVEMPIPGNHRRILRLLEPGMPGYERRLSTLARLGQAGIRTTVHIDLRPGSPIYNEGFIPELAAAGATSVFVSFQQTSNECQDVEVSDDYQNIKQSCKKFGLPFACKAIK